MKISLIQRKLKDGRISLSLEFYRGSEMTNDGKRKHLRSFENLDTYLIDNPKTAKEKKDNKEALQFAENILAIRKAEYAQGRFELKNTAKSKRVFLNFFAELTEEHLKKIVSKNMTFDEIDENFVKKVYRYFEKDALTRSELPLSQNSKYSYFNKFKAALRNAFDNGYLTINYAAKIKSFEQAESQREYLIFDELQRLAKAE
ncbi:phage integrase SAM-like domain-containing protein [Chryseobacterium scophthalmum]|uniref:phage integrase SAM-like domain-containing protein n=1 Tax=Chryseobacterium scophthalmum TaxID=59733 RepID=UPI000B2FFF8C|nr:phage integrase SAM-like domain-containing protein [Chryseobacterium scophthalmum]